MTLRLPAWALILLVALAIAVLLTLGTWQVLRLFEARDTAQRFDERITQPPVAWSSTLDAEDEALHFRRIAVEGEWDFENSAFITARTRYGLLGEEIITPLLPDGGGPALLVNRGWYPLEQREAVLDALAEEERGSVDGLLRQIPDERARQSNAGHWSWFDPRSIAEALPYAAAPVQVLQGRLATEEELYAITSAALPVQLYEGYRNDTPHLEYAVTWYGLAAALLATVVIRARAGEQPRPPALDDRRPSRAL